MATKKILGLDLGTTSIGWAYVIEDDNYEKSEIKQLGVRVNPLTVDEQTNFEKGKPFSVNAGRTLKRGMRRNLDRYQLRREQLKDILTKAGIINEATALTEIAKNTTHSTWTLRAKAATERIELEELARILFAINKKRGYKSSRKAKNEDEGQAIDGMAIAKTLYEESITPGQLVFQRLMDNKRAIPDFYRSDLQAEFDKVWSFQKQFYPDILTEEFYKELQGKGQRATAALFWTKHGFSTADIKDMEDSLKTERTIKLNLRDRKKLQAYKWRSQSITKQLDKEEVAYVLTEINNNLNNSSGYLGAISDRSKELYFNRQTIGQYLFAQLQKNFHTSLKNQVFYRQDYLDEFEAIWETQAKHHPVLTRELKEEIRDIIIFYQRKLKSQKGLISFCEFESKEVELTKDGKTIKKTIGARVAPRSSLLFQEFKIWQLLNNILIRKKGSRKRVAKKDAAQTSLLNSDSAILTLDQEAKQYLFDELNIKGNISSKAILELLGKNAKEFELNYEQIEGNRTNKALYEAYLNILEIEGYDVKDLLKVKSNKDEVELNDLTVPASEIKSMIQSIFKVLNIDTNILEFDASLAGAEFEKQASYQLWHLLYSYEGDDSVSGNEKLYDLLQKKFGFSREHARVLANVTLEDDYGNLSSKAMRRIFPFIKESMYSEACELAGYRHSKHSLTTEEIEKRTLKPKLELLKKNSLRQPVVEKILNQMVNVVNALIDKENDQLELAGKPRDFHFDEVRIELARELKKNAAERAEMTTNINSAAIEHEKIEKILQNEFGIKNPTKNDRVRYKLYEELADNGYKDLYTNKKIEKQDLFSHKYDIDHILPQSRLFDDSYSNKVLVARSANLEKGNQTGYDYMSNKGAEAFENYIGIVEDLFQKKKINKAKYLKLLKPESEIGDGFIERDLRQTQYIAKKAKEMLFEITRSVVPTTGSITDRLREDWGLINVMKEINLPKYRALGLTEMQERKEGKTVEVIKDWTKRNDHRHHAMDALTIAFTRHNHIQYLNYLNARKNVNHKMHANVTAIEDKETTVITDKNGDKKRVFREPISNLRQLAKEHLESIIISHKAKNKVITKNKNKIAGKSKAQVTLTPRGQLHKETVYGKYHFYDTKEVKIGSTFDLEMIQKVAKRSYREALLARLAEYGNDPKKAFTGKNALSKNPIYLDPDKKQPVPESVRVAWLEPDYSIRKDILPENFKDEKSIDKIIDRKVRAILKERLKEFGGDAKKAFSDLDKNPIWLNKEKGIAIKRVTISGVSNAEALHYKKDHKGNLVLNEKSERIPVDFVSTGNNHHVAIYRDEKGNLQEQVVSFFEAVTRVNQGLSVIDKTYNAHLGWQFLFTMKQNELFVFPNEKTGFNPTEIDLLDPINKSSICSNLYRVQKFSFKDYVFRHHLETTVERDYNLKGLTWNDFRSSQGLDKIIKVRINHLGDIVSIGEY